MGNKHPSNSQGRGSPASDNSRSASRRPQLRAKVMRLIGLGTELATFTLVPAGIGYWIDSFRQHDKPYATAAFTFLGFAAGMYRFIRESQRSNTKENEKRDAQSQSDVRTHDDR